MHLKRLLVVFASAALISSCKTSRDFPPPDVDLCSMGKDSGGIYIDCEPWFYEGRAGYEVSVDKAAATKYFLVAPNHYRALQKYIEKLDRELSTCK